jgi:MATE family multidrug resistance protein
MTTNSHPFLTKPHSTLIGLSLPVMASLVVEPLAGLVDTAFVERLGAAYAAALAAATTIFAGVVWVFNFLGIGTQTAVAQSQGRGDTEGAREVGTVAIALAAACGVALAIVVWPLLNVAAHWMSEDVTVQGATVTYLEIRFLGAPAILIMLANLGALRGLQRMQATFWIAGGVSLANIVLDPILIFGWGPIPSLEIAGAAWSTTLSQVGGALASLVLVRRALGYSSHLSWRRATELLAVGRDMVVRTGALLLFLLIATRTALQAGVDAGAAHQAIRQIWLMTAFLLDAFAHAAQSLIGFFLGAGNAGAARRVARVACAWGLATGLALALTLVAAEGFVVALLVPPSAVALFSSAWLVCALVQPFNSLSFVTDGIHWGTGDFPFLRNAMLVSTLIGLACIARIDTDSPSALTWVWWVTGLWIGIRAAFGITRIWPGSNTSPLRADPAVERAPMS